MTQKERSLLTIKAILIHTANQQASTNPVIHTDFLIQKLDACFSLIRPEVLLSIEELKIYNGLLDSLRKDGRII